ncbi:cellulase family glycosylhydrolase [candidate division FCPU426 bacterium]|nr:cellulase family glycosylhydrolase [candidate division FCPU426 bacterium]
MTKKNGNHSIPGFLLLQSLRLLYFLAATVMIAAQPCAAAVSQPADFWFDGFTGAAGAKPSGWLDDSDNGDFNCLITYAGDAGSANIARTADSVWGKVLSTPLITNPGHYPYIEITVTTKSANCTWVVGIQEAGSANYWDLCAPQSAPGTYQLDYAAITGWQEEKRFHVQISVNGNPGEHITVDSIRLYGERRNDPSSAFIAVDAQEPDQLTRQGIIVKLKGANYYPSLSGWDSMWRDWNRDLLHAELPRARALGINCLRTFIHYNEFGQAQVRPEVLARMEELLYIADKYHLPVQFTFFPLTRTYAPAYRADMKSHVQTIVARFANDSRILGWGVTNELDICMESFGQDQVAISNASQWHAEIAELIKTTAPKQLVIAPTAWPESMRYLSMENIDVYCLHTYGSQYTPCMVLNARQHMQQHNKIMPLLIEECGMDFNVFKDEYLIHNYFHLLLEHVQQTDISGAMVWALTDIIQGPPYAPQYWGLYTAAGAIRAGIHSSVGAHQSTDFSQLASVPRFPSIAPFENPAVGPETTVFSHQLPLGGNTFSTFNASYQIEAAGIRIGSIGEDFPFGSISTVHAFTIDLTQGADLYVTVNDCQGRWYAFVRHTASGLKVRLQQDTPTAGDFVYNLNHFLPSGLQTKESAFTLEIGAVKTNVYGNYSCVLVESAKVVNGSRSTPTVTPTATVVIKPQLFEISACPNPAREKVEFLYRMKGELKIIIDVYNLLGERIAHITEEKNSCSYQIMKTSWETLHLAPGIYFCRIMVKTTAGEVIFQENRKIAIIR